MKTIVCAVLLFAVSAFGLWAEDLPEMGLALRYESAEGGLFATHRTHPFGTTLLITNMVYDTKIEVQVGGRPSNDSQALVELSPMACEFLGIEAGILTQVTIEVVAKPTTAAPAMRARLKVIQTGRAVAQSSGADMSAFHPSIALNTRATLTNTANGRSVVVTIKGRIQANKDHIIEISQAAAQNLGIRGSGEIHLETN